MINMPTVDTCPNIYQKTNKEVQKENICMKCLRNRSHDVEILRGEHRTTSLIRIGHRINPSNSPRNLAIIGQLENSANRGSANVVEFELRVPLVHFEPVEPIVTFEQVVPVLPLVPCCTCLLVVDVEQPPIECTVVKKNIWKSKGKIWKSKGLRSSRKRKRR